MCLAIPSRIVEIKDFTALIDVRGARRRISLILLPEEASVGDYVLVHAGFAIQKVNPDAARESEKVLKELNRLLQVEDTLA